MENQNKSNTWLKRHRLLVGSGVLVIGCVVNVCIAVILSSLVGFIFLGVGILFTVLIGGNILSERGNLTTGEVRRAIAISCICVFFGLLAFGETIKTEVSIPKEILEKFLLVIIIIIGFYFGGRSAEEIVKTIKNKGKKEE